MAAESLGLATSIFTLCEIGIKTIKFIRDIQKASDDQIAIASELTTLVNVLQSLRQEVVTLEQKNADQELLMSLKFQLKPLLDSLHGKLGEVAALVDKPHSSRSRVKWLWKKDECKEFQTQLGTVLGAIQIILEQNNLSQVVAVKQNTDLIPVLDASISRLSSRVEQTRQVVIQDQNDRIRERVMQWVSPWDHSNRHNAACGKRARDSGSWFLQNATFQSWCHTRGSTLWCTGIPGAGKTIIMSSAIEYLREQFKGDTRVGIAFIYFESTGQDQLKHDDVICNIYKQIMFQTTIIPDDLLGAWETNGKAHNKPPDCKTILSLLEYETTQRDIYVILDALDECIFTDLIRILKTLQGLGTKINLLMSSRPLDLAEYNLHVRLTLTIEPDQSDMQSYINYRLEDESALADIVAGDPEFGRTVLETVLEKAQKMFLLVKYHMDSLTAEGTRKNIRKKLYSLPADLNSVYDGAMDRIRAQNSYRRELAIEVLSWISYASRPLQLVELIHALAIEIGEKTFDQENQVERTGDILSSCAGLINISATDKTVQFGHETIREYFQQYRDTLFPSARADTTRKCLTYLLYEDMSRTTWERRDLLAAYPFIGYAAYHWGNHARGVPEQDLNVQSEALRFMELDFRASDEFTETCNPLPADKALQKRQWNLRHTSCVLHVVTRFGLNHLLSVLLERQGDPNQVDEHGQTALHWACVDGHASTVELLLDKGADIDAKVEWNHSTALNLASINGFFPIVKILVERGADVNIPCLHGGPGLAALPGACNHGHFEIAKYLLDHGASIEVEKTQNKRGNRVSVVVSTLMWAMNVGIDMFQLLIDKGADISGKYCFRCVKIAIERRQPEFIHALIKANADIQWTPTEATPNVELAIRSGYIPSISTFHNNTADGGDNNTKWATNLLFQQTWFTETVNLLIDNPTSVSSNSTAFVKRKKYKRDTSLSYDEETQEPYMGIIIPEDFSTVQQITIWVTSHDQGFSHDKEHYGTYEASNTWFALFVQFRSESPLSQIEHTVQKNVHASLEWRTHEVVLRRDGDNPYIADTISRLRPGDVLQVLARAQFPAWVNYVQGMEMELVA